jgi:hypothetical protein
MFGSMTTRRAIVGMLVGTWSLAACAEPEAADLDTMTMIGKCVFTDRFASEIEQGEVFLYALRDVDGSHGIVTGTASTSDSLLDVVARQSPSEILPARRLAPARLEFGGLAPDGTGDAEHFVSMGVKPREVFTSVGTTYATEHAYPSCVFWE